MATSKCDNRKAFPATAEVVDKFRAIFGPGVKLIHAKEGEREIGRKPEEGVKLAEFLQ